MEQRNHVSSRIFFVLLLFAVFTALTITRPAFAQPATHDQSEEHARKTQPDRQHREPALLAHRGLVRHCPENTLPSYEAADELGLSNELDDYQTSHKKLDVNVSLMLI